MRTLAVLGCQASKCCESWKNNSQCQAFVGPKLASSYAEFLPPIRKGKCWNWLGFKFEKISSSRNFILGSVCISDVNLRLKENRLFAPNYCGFPRIYFSMENDSIEKKQKNIIFAWNF